MKTIIEFIISPILVAFLGYIIWLLQQSRKVTDANAIGTMLLLRREIIEDHRRFVIEKEIMTAADYAYLDEVYKAYKDLNGNGMADKLFKELTKVETGEAA